MAVKNTANESSKPTGWKEPFEFVLTVNGSIICQRYFQIENFNRTSLKSTQLTDTIRYCVSLIQENLKRKSSSYLYKSAPKVFNNKEEFEKNKDKVKVTDFVVLEDTDTVFVYNGKAEDSLEPYNGRFNRGDYAVNNSWENGKCELKFAFNVNGKEVCSMCWDGNDYPRFIRTNIDLSNSKNKYKGGDMYLPFECAMIDILNSEEEEDLIPKIAEEISICCSYENSNDYITKVKYSDKTYSLNIYRTNEEYYRNVEKAYRKKTNAYMKSIY